MEIESRYSRRAILTVSGVAMTMPTGGCLGDLITRSDDSNTDRSSSYVEVDNRNSSSHEVTFHVVDKTTGTDIVEKTVSIPANDDHQIDFTVDGDPTIVEVTVTGETDSDTIESSIEGSYRSFHGEINEYGAIRLSIMER